MHEVIEEKKGGDGEDLTSQLVNADLGDDEMTDADLASFFILLVVAGNETTRNAISWGLKYLTDNPDQQSDLGRRLRRRRPDRDRGDRTSGSSPVTYMRRTTTADTVAQAASSMAAGDKVSMFYLAANRDEDVFDDPYKFDVRRDPNVHVGFGGPGPHFCLGAHLARREITVMFRELFERLPDIAATSEPSLLASSFIHGVKHLDATFTPQPARS